MISILFLNQANDFNSSSNFTPYRPTAPATDTATHAPAAGRHHGPDRAPTREETRARRSGICREQPQEGARAAGGPRGPRARAGNPSSTQPRRETPDPGTPTRGRTDSRTEGRGPRGGRGTHHAGRGGRQHRAARGESFPRAPSARAPRADPPSPADPTAAATAAATATFVATARATATQAPAAGRQRAQPTEQALEEAARGNLFWHLEQRVSLALGWKQSQRIGWL